MTASIKITQAVARKLGWYVYAYVNPIDERVFYVGKGHGRRVLHHLGERALDPKASMIRAIRRAGFEPRLEIIAHGLKDAETALRIEAALIDALGLKALSNRVRGWGAIKSGRVPLNELITQYSRRRVEVREPAILIRINRQYHPGMTPVELYDATRGVWKLGPQRGSARFALAVFESVVREVYEITGWFPAGSTFSTREPKGVRRHGRFEFVGRVASDPVRRRYVGRYVGHLFRPGAQNPICYVGVKRAARKRGTLFRKEAAQ